MKKENLAREFGDTRVGAPSSHRRRCVIPPLVFVGHRPRRLHPLVVAARPSPARHLPPVFAPRLRLPSPSPPGVVAVPPSFPRGCRVLLRSTRDPPCEQLLAAAGVGAGWCSSSCLVHRSPPVVLPLAVAGAGAVSGSWSRRRRQ
jgi:hypothetical protein